MRLLIILFVILGSVGDVYASEKLVAEFKSKSQERVTIIQKETGYGLDLIISKFDVTSNIKMATKKVPNAFGIVLDKPSTIFMCWIANGEFFPESFQIFDIRTFQSNILQLKSNPLSMGDELECLIEENEKYFLVFDNFTSGGSAYLFDRNGKQLRIINGGLKKNIEIEGKVYRFINGHEFGGFMPENRYLPVK